MTDHRFDPVVIGVGGNVGRCHHVAGVKNIQALVFHGPEVKVIGCHNAEAVQIELQSETLLIPANCFFQTFERMRTFGVVVRFGPDA